MPKVNRIFERIVNLIGWSSIIASISIVSYFVYDKYYYVATQPFEIYTASTDIEEILNDSEYGIEKEKGTGEKADWIYIEKGDVMVFEIADEKFAFKYLLDGYMRFDVKKGDYFYWGGEDTDIYHFITKNPLYFSINPKQKYDGQDGITSFEIIEFVQEGKWTGNY